MYKIVAITMKVRLRVTNFDATPKCLSKVAKLANIKTSNANKKTDLLFIFT